jgi:hypothetical protein
MEKRKNIYILRRLLIRLWIFQCNNMNHKIAILKIKEELIRKPTGISSGEFKNVGLSFCHHSVSVHWMQIQVYCFNKQISTGLLCIILFAKSSEYVGYFKVCGELMFLRIFCNLCTTYLNAWPVGQRVYNRIRIPVFHHWCRLSRTPESTLVFDFITGMSRCIFNFFLIKALTKYKWSLRQLRTENICHALFKFVIPKLS